MIDIHDIHQQVPYIATLGVVPDHRRADRVQTQLELAPGLSTIGGGLHGGALMGLADIAAAVYASAATAEACQPP